jgi:hypothetical protein
LAPYLYILAHDVLALILRDPPRNILGLQLPDGSSFSNLNFADNSMLYLLAQIDNLDRAKVTLEDFCLASGSLVNGNKSHAILVSRNPQPLHWGIQMGLDWIPTGAQATHLGIPVGFRLPQKVRDEAALVRIHTKLAYWGGQQFSQAGRILIANQVLLACVWFSASCTDLSHSILIKSHAAVRDYVWSGRNNHHPRAKVTWNFAIQPLALGGVKLLDPVLQSSALLSRLLIRGLSLGFEPWKSFLLHKLRSIKLVRQGTWLASASWLFSAVKICRSGSHMRLGI